MPDKNDPKMWSSNALALPPAPVLSPHRNVARLVGVFAVGVMAGVLVTWGYQSAITRSTIAGPNNAPMQEAGVVGATTPSTQAPFEVASPQPAGKKVAIKRATVATPTWVVVYESVNGAPGRALGASLFSAQKNTGTVTLLRATTKGKSYLVGQATDNGSGTYSSADKPVMVDNKRLLLTFTAQ